jgi:uncharacterized SAM-binding protein YcdF (DUF218 family)
MMVLRLVAGILGKPLLLATILAGIGMLLQRGSRRRVGIWLIAGGAILAYLGSTSLVGNALLGHLERQYPPFDPSRAIGVRDIVVLGSSYEPHDGIPVTGALDADGLARIAEGVRLARARPGSRLVVSGGAPGPYVAGARGYAQLAADLGIERSALTVMDHALDTDQEARDIAGLLGRTPFILVTSAYHMPRAMLLMQRAGANALPASTGQLVHAQRRVERFGFLPGSHGLRKTETALHEYLGLAAISLRVN